MNAHHRRIVPFVTYACVFLGAAFLYYLAANFDYVPRSGAPGPDAWPKGILALAMLAAVFGFVRAFRAPEESEEESLLIEVLPETEVPLEAALEAESPRYPMLLIGGMIATLGYVYFVDKLGFFLTTTIYLVVFLLLGRYRRWRAIAGVSLIGSLVLMYVFMKIVYVSLPLGVGPFAELSIALMKLMGIR